MDEFMEETTSGTRTRLRLRSNLIGFREVPGRHTGQHLATAFLYVLERIGITNRVSNVFMIRLHPCLHSINLDWVDNIG
jgi:hypothetical protein